MHDDVIHLGSKQISCHLVFRQSHRLDHTEQSYTTGIKKPAPIISLRIDHAPCVLAPPPSPTPSTDRSLSVLELYLCDSGAQYRDGTTDVTRTVHFGTPTAQEKVMTYVLDITKGLSSYGNLYILQIKCRLLAGSFV